MGAGGFAGRKLGEIFDIIIKNPTFIDGMLINSLANRLKACLHSGSLNGF